MLKAVGQVSVEELRFCCYLLCCGAESRLVSAGGPGGPGGAEGLLRHVLGLLHQLGRLHHLHGDQVEGVQVLQTRRQTRSQSTPGLLPSGGSWSSAHLLLGGVVDGCQGDEAGDVLSFFLEDAVIPDDSTNRIFAVHRHEPRLNSFTGLPAAYL